MKSDIDRFGRTRGTGGDTAELPRADLAAAMEHAAAAKPRMSAARPPEGAHTVAEGEGAPSCAARPPEGAHTVAEGEGAPVSAAVIRDGTGARHGATRRGRA